MMGIAAYQRGSRAISEDITREFYRRRGQTPPCDYAERTPVPHPPGWGSKTLARAVAKARGLLRFYAARGETHDAAWITDAVRCDSKFTEACAREATRIALEEFDAAREESPPGDVQGA